MSIKCFLSHGSMQEKTQLKLHRKAAGKGRFIEIIGF